MKSSNSNQQIHNINVPTTMNIIDSDDTKVVAEEAVIVEKFNTKNLPYVKEIIDEFYDNYMNSKGCHHANFMAEVHTGKTEFPPLDPLCNLAKARFHDFIPYTRFVWDPILQFKMTALCPVCNKKLHSDGWSRNPKARRVFGLDRIVYLFSKVYRCRVCSVRHNSTSTAFMKLLPPVVADSFPFALSTLSGITMGLKRYYKTIRGQNIPVSKFYDMLLESYSLNYLTRIKQLLPIVLETTNKEFFPKEIPLDIRKVIGPLPTGGFFKTNKLCGRNEFNNLQFNCTKNSPSCFYAIENQDSTIENSNRPEQAQTNEMEFSLETEKLLTEQLTAHVENQSLRTHTIEAMEYPAKELNNDTFTIQNGNVSPSNDMSNLSFIQESLHPLGQTAVKPIQEDNNQQNKDGAHHPDREDIQYSQRTESMHISCRALPKTISIESIQQGFPNLPSGFFYSDREKSMQLAMTNNIGVGEQHDTSKEKIVVSQPGLQSRAVIPKVSHKRKQHITSSTTNSKNGKGEKLRKKKKIDTG